MEAASGRLLVESQTAMPIAGRSDPVLKELTCQTLVTAWGYRPSGQLDILGSLMCRSGSGRFLETSVNELGVTREKISS
jgi:hypothetical protein